MLAAVSVAPLSTLHTFAAAAAATCSPIRHMCIATQLSAGGFGDICRERMNSGPRAVSAAPRRVSASLTSGPVLAAAASARSFATRSADDGRPKLPKDMLHVNGIGKSYAKVLRDMHGIKTVQQLSERIIETLQATDGKVSGAPAVKLLQGYGIKRVDHAQRVIQHLTSLYAPELLKQLQAEDAAVDKQGRPSITFCVEGNISAGKSTFLGYITQGNEQLQQELGVVHEPVEQWQSVRTVEGDTLNLLDKFYSDPPKYAYTFQNYVFMSRVLQEKNSAGMLKPVRVMERSVFSDRMVFVRAVRESGWMGDVELAVYDSWFNPILEQSPHLKPHGFIYLKCDPSTCMDRLKLRGRHEEDSISIDYLEGLHAKHEDWLGAGQLAFDVHGRLGSKRSRNSTRATGLFVPDNLRSSLYYLDKDGRRAPPDMHESLHLAPALVLDCNRDVLNDESARQDVQDKVIDYIAFMREHIAWQQQQADSLQRLRGAMGRRSSSELYVWGAGAQPGSPWGQQEEAVNTVRETLRGSDVKVVPSSSGTLATSNGKPKSREPTGSLEVLQTAANAAARLQQTAAAALCSAKP